MREDTATMSDAAVVESPHSQLPPQAARQASAGAREQRRPKKRRRVVVSCTECHRRKQKCDRGLPCSNCRSRNKEASCVYEAGAPTAKLAETQHSSLSPESAADGAASSSRTPAGMTRVPVSALIDHHPHHAHHHDPSAAAVPESADVMSSMAAQWGYSNTSTSTMGFLKTIEAADAEGMSSLSLDMPRSAPAAREKYKNLIRQLPARTYLDRLINLYITQLNWHYYMVDEAIFERQLAEWNGLSFRALKAAPEGLSSDLQVFPAVLFQICATSLLSLDETPDSDFDALKYAGNMTFEDLAAEYSEVGAAIVSLFPKKDLAVTTVQAEFLRASFLKFNKNVSESWHAVAVTIRDAQELGMHKDSLDPKPRDNSAEAALENQWHIEQRRRLYGLLAIWDVHMSLILARPGVIDWRNPLPSPPVDIRPTRDLSRTPVVPRDPERDPPTPVTSLLWMLQLIRPLRDVLDLEKEGPFPKDFSRVERIHQHLLEVEEGKPQVLRSGDEADRRWDDMPELYWLPYKRTYYSGLVLFGIMALHRPYIFHRRASREAALRAGINMLELQRQSFQGLPSHSWRNYHLFFGSFDGIVLIATIFILFPREQTELRQSALQQFQWTIERFGAMQDRNPYARSGLGILKAILAKLTRTIDSEPSPAAAATVSSETSGQTTWSGYPSVSTPSASGILSAGGDTGTNTPNQDVGSSMHQTNHHSAAGGMGSAPGDTDWTTMPDNDALAQLAPLFPTSDLLFNDLNAIFDGAGNFALPHDDPTAAATGMGVNDMNIDPGLAFPGAQFGGGFGEDTVWQLLNQYQPGTSV